VVSFLLRRLTLAVAVTLSVSIIAFLLLRLTGDVAVALAGEGASNVEIEAIRARYRLDRALPIQYIDWLWLVLSGDLGMSLYFRQPVLDVIDERIWTTLALSLLGLIFASAVGIPLGVMAGMRPNTWLDRVALAISSFGQAMPIFWFSLLLILVFGVYLKILPVSGGGTAAHYVLPSISLSYYFAPALMRLTRAGMIQAYQSDYVRAAFAKGLRERTVVLKHALPNALLPVISLAAVQFGFMLSGSIITESIFSLPGLGHLAWTSIGRGDFPVLQGILLVFSLVFVALVFLADLITAWLDPRLRSG
jgi:ABC-type dipeptide/oligopeptide/nickel transport system permease component